MWILVFGITQVVLGVLTCLDNRPSAMKAKNEALQAGKQPKQNPILALGGCFYCVWFIIGNVWFFWFTPETVFAPMGAGNGTDTHSENCAVLENFGFILLICLWTVPFVLICCVYVFVFVMPMIMKQRQANFANNYPMGARDSEESRPNPAKLPEVRDSIIRDYSRPNPAKLPEVRDLF